MPLINWDDSMSVGIRAIDQQHKVLLGLLNDLSDAIARGSDKEVLGKIIAELAEYTDTHFAYEEGLMAQTNYPEAEQHGLEHEGLIASVLEIQSRFEAGDVEALSQDTLTFLKDWLNDHILGTDMAYAEHMRTSLVA